jgi:hypothetical protein
MAIIDPAGLFHGERLGACSDQAKLLWPWLFVAANGNARLELSYRAIVAECFSGFAEPPSEQQLWTVFEELAANYLVILYEVEGTWWAQFDTSEKYLPRYKTKRDEESPAPARDARERHRAGYLEWKKAKSIQNQHFQKFSESSINLPKISNGIGGGDGDGGGEGHARDARKEPPPAHDSKHVIPVARPREPMPSSPGANGELMAVTWLCEELSIALAPAQRTMAAKHIAFTGRETGKADEALLIHIRGEAMAARARGEPVDAWYLADGKWRGGQDGESRSSPAHQRVSANKRAIADALAKRTGESPGDNAGADGRPLPKPRPRGLDGGIPVGLRAAGPPVLDG